MRTCIPRTLLTMGWYRSLWERPALESIMINAVLVFNNSGQPRLTKFYTQLVCFGLYYLMKWRYAMPRISILMTFLGHQRAAAPHLRNLYPRIPSPCFSLQLPPVRFSPLPTSTTTLRGILNKVNSLPPLLASTTPPPPSVSRLSYSFNFMIIYFKSPQFVAVRAADADVVIPLFCQ